MKKIFIKGLNTCVQRRQNIEKYRRFAEAQAYQIVDYGSANEIWVWTCGFRKDAKENTLEYIRQLRDFDGTVILGGCLPDIAYSELESCCSENLKDWRIIPWRHETELLENGKRINQFDIAFCEAAVCDNVDEEKKVHPDSSLTFADQFQKLVISYGCNCDCVYCSERIAFPAYHSFPPDILVEECRRLIESNCRYKVMLVADSLGEYGCDLLGDVTLIDLINRICLIDERVQVALNNFNPQFALKFLPELCNLIGQGKIAHINLPIQSASTSVLQRMKRHYTKEDLIKILNAFHELHFDVYDTHIIVGFDGETETEFYETIDFICKQKVRYVLASAYMDMSYGKAGQTIPSEVKKSRLAYAQKRCSDAGIIINCDNGSVATDRLRRIQKGA